MPTSSDDTFQPASFADIAGEPSLGFLVILHMVVGLCAWFTPVMISEGGAFCIPYNLAFLYTPFCCALLHYTTNNGATRAVWLAVLPLGALFIAWSIPFGVVFLWYSIISYTTIRGLQSQNTRLLIPAILYALLVVFMFAY
ncbi:MAG: hypothetical protein IPO40_11130 [Fibrobacteres bacterium]|nr:hypothetical protein [Fibrobacterota bacterium]